MRINKFRHQVFQPVPSSISNKCDSTSNLSFITERNIQIAEINSEFHSSHLRKSSLQHSKPHLKRPATKWAAWAFWRSCSAEVSPHNTRNRNKEGQDSLWHRFRIRAISQPKRCQYKHHLPWELAPQCDNASRFLQRWDTEEVSCKSRGKSKQEQTLPDLPSGSDTTKLQPLSLCSCAPQRRELQ